MVLDENLFEAKNNNFEKISDMIYQALTRLGYLVNADKVGYAITKRINPSKKLVSRQDKDFDFVTDEQLNDAKALLTKANIGYFVKRLLNQPTLYIDLTNFDEDDVNIEALERSIEDRFKGWLRKLYTKKYKDKSDDEIIKAFLTFVKYDANDDEIAELEDILDEFKSNKEKMLTESVADLTSIKIPGYTDTWSAIDVFTTSGPDFTRYFLMENDKYGDETQYLVVSEDLSEVYETYDDIETALRDEGILESLNEDKVKTSKDKESLKESYSQSVSFWDWANSVARSEGTLITPVSKEVDNLLQDGEDEDYINEADLPKLKSIVDEFSYYLYDSKREQNVYAIANGQIYFSYDRVLYMNKKDADYFAKNYNLIVNKVDVNFDDLMVNDTNESFRVGLPESKNESIIKTSKDKWVNKGKEGTHGEFSTKKKAREQQKAMFASRWKGESLEENADRISIESDFEDITNMSDAKERLKKYDIDLIKKDNRNYILRKDGKEYTFYVLDNPNEVRKDLARAVHKLTDSIKDAEYFIPEDGREPRGLRSRSEIRQAANQFGLKLDEDDRQGCFVVGDKQKIIAFLRKYYTDRDVDEEISFISESVKDAKPDKPEFPAKGKWEWDEVQYDWYDTGRGAYYEEIKRGNNIVDSIKDNMTSKEFDHWSYHAAYRPNDRYKLNQILDLFYQNGYKLFDRDDEDFDDELSDAYANASSSLKNQITAIIKDSAIKDNSITESKGVIRKYKGYTLHDTGDTITITDPHGKTVGTERTEISVEGLIDDLVVGKDIKENIGSDIAEYQKWVDYDMKKYGRISSLTNHKVRKAGLKIVKDKYGDYEVIANEPIREDLEREFTIHYNREGFEFGGYGAVRVKATNEDEAKEKFYAEKKDDKITISSIRPTENEDIRKGIRLLEDKGFDEIEEIGESKFGTKEYKYKKYTIEHFPIDAHMDGMEPQHIESYIIKSPAVLTNSGYHLPLYCEDEKGNEVNFRSLQQAKDWIDKFDGKFKLQWKHGDELHAVINDESLEESLKNNEVADFFDKAKKLGVKTLKDLKILLAQPESKGDSEKEKLDNYSKEANPEDKDLTEDVEVVDKNQTEIDKKVGLENLLNDLINDENEAINGYNSAIVNFELEGKSDLTDVFRDIIKDEQNHIGNLQKVLNEINPTTIANLEQGQQEAADTLNK